MIRISEVLPAFRQADAQVFIETFPFDTMQYQTAFPLQYQPTLKWQGIEAEFGAKVMAAVVDFNSRAPRYGRPTPSKIEGDMPKLEIARDKVETDFNELRELENSVRLLPPGPTRREAARRVLEWHYDDQVFVRNGIEARLEWLAKRIATTGKYSLTQENNEQGIKTKVSVDFAIPSQNFFNASVPWTDPNADIVADIRRIVKAAKDKGKPVPRYIWCEEGTIDLVSANPKFQKFVASYIINSLGLQQEPDLESINRALRNKRLPVFKVWESMMVQENKDGTQTAVTGWEPGVVTFSPTETLGATQHTISADEYVTAGVATKTKSGIVLIKTWGLEDPITVVTKGTAYATPVLNNSKNTYILRTTPPTT